jgi:replicative superfamily II helicase
VERHLRGKCWLVSIHTAGAAIASVVADGNRVMPTCTRQVLVFVHTRRDTAATARFLLTTAQRDAAAHLFLSDPATLPAIQQRSATGRDAASVKNAYVNDRLRRLQRQDRGGGECMDAGLREFWPQGVGIHHAGLGRADRDRVERAFEAGQACAHSACGPFLCVFGPSRARA